MSKTLTLCFVFVLLVTPLSARQSQAPKDAANWDAFRFLLGDWVGEGTGTPGEATGGFSFTFDLEGKVLVRRNRADYPATKDKPAYSHTDLMVIYQEDQATRAIYFDNEGHVIHYTVSFSKDQNALTFLGDPSPSAPRFRFTYNKVKNGGMTFQFDIAPPGKPEGFTKYLEGSLHRK
jgi:hypothetical protein